MYIIVIVIAYIYFYLFYIHVFSEVNKITLFSSKKNELLIIYFDK